MALVLSPMMIKASSATHPHGPSHASAVSM